MIFKDYHCRAGNFDVVPCTVLLALEMNRTWESFIVDISAAGFTLDCPSHSEYDTVCFVDKAFRSRYKFRIDRGHISSNDVEFSRLCPLTVRASQPHLG